MDDPKELAKQVTEYQRMILEFLSKDSCIPPNKALTLAFGMLMVASALQQNMNPDEIYECVVSNILNNLKNNELKLHIIDVGKVQ